MEGAGVIYLLDTNVWLNRAMIPSVIPARIHSMMRGEPCGLASISFLEAAILHRKGRLNPMTGTLRELIGFATGRDVEPMDLTPEIAALTNELPEDFQGDPFDRTIAATARAHRLTLITTDDKIRDAGFCNVEYFPFKPSRIRD